MWPREILAKIVAKGPAALAQDAVHTGVATVVSPLAFYTTSAMFGHTIRCSSANPQCNIDPFIEYGMMGYGLSELVYVAIILFYAFTDSDNSVNKQAKKLIHFIQEVAKPTLRNFLFTLPLFVKTAGFISVAAHDDPEDQGMIGDFVFVALTLLACLTALLAVPRLIKAVGKWLAQKEYIFPTFNNLTRGERPWPSFLMKSNATFFFYFFVSCLTALPIIGMTRFIMIASILAIDKNWIATPAGLLTRWSAMGAVGLLTVSVNIAKNLFDQHAAIHEFFENLSAKILTIMAKFLLLIAVTLYTATFFKKYLWIALASILLSAVVRFLELSPLSPVPRHQDNFVIEDLDLSENLARTPLMSV